MAEQAVLPLASEISPALFAPSHRLWLQPAHAIDFLAINGMTYGAWKSGVLPLMRDGTQWRPMVHVKDTARAQIFMLTADPHKINGQIFNVGSDENNYQLGAFGEESSIRGDKDCVA